VKNIEFAKKGDKYGFHFSGKYIQYIDSLLLGGPQQLSGSGWAAGEKARETCGTTVPAAGDLPGVSHHAAQPVHGPSSWHPQRYLANII
jgi:hypothetical protein